MPTPNWGPQAGVPMDDATFADYSMANPPPDAKGYSPSRDSNKPTYGVGPSPLQQAKQGAGWWEDFYLRQAGASPMQMPQFQTGNQDQARLEQQRVIQALQQQARGDLNSLAQQQLQQGYGQARAQQSSLGSTMRGQGAGAAMRGIQQGQQGIQRGFAGDQQMLMFQEQQAAQALLAQMLQQQQGQDITQAAGMAGGQMQGDALNQAMQQFYLGQGVQSALGREQLGLKQFMGEQGLNAQLQALTDDLVRSGTQAVAAGTGSLMNMGGQQQQPKPGYAQSDIDKAFYGG